MTKSEEVTDAYLQEVTPEFEASLSEEDKTFETTVMISLEALGVLEQLKEATEVFILILAKQPGFASKSLKFSIFLSEMHILHINLPLDFYYK